MHTTEIVFRRTTSEESRIFYRDEYYGGARQPVRGWDDDLRDPSRRRRSVQPDCYPALDRLQTGAQPPEPQPASIRLRVRRGQNQIALPRALPRQIGLSHLAMFPVHG